MGGEDVEVNIPLKSTTQQEAIKDLFNAVDQNKDGRITLRELEDWMERNSSHPVAETVLRMYQLSDTDKDRSLNLKEFTQMIHDPRFKSIFWKYFTRYVNLIVPPRPTRKKEAGIDSMDAKSYETEYSCCPPKLGMIIISLVEVALYFIDELNEKKSTNYAKGPMAQILIFDPAKRYEAWRFLTYMFVHIGYMHLIVNLILQLCVGIPLEMVHGWWRVLLIYFTGVIGGSMGTSITDPRIKLAGASGGVYSLILAHIATIIMNWREMTLPLVQFSVFVCLLGADVAYAIYKRYWANLNEQIGYAAHFFGAFVGLLVGISVLRNLEVTNKEKVIWWFAAISYSMLMLIGICWNIFGGDYFPKQI